METLDILLNASLGRHLAQTRHKSLLARAVKLRQAYESITEKLHELGADSYHSVNLSKEILELQYEQADFGVQLALKEDEALTYERASIIEGSAERHQGQEEQLLSISKRKISIGRDLWENENRKRQVKRRLRRKFQQTMDINEKASKYAES